MILTIMLWFLSISTAASLGFVLGACIAFGKCGDVDLMESPVLLGEAGPEGLYRIHKGARGRNSEPHLVLVSPTEFRAVKS